MKQVVYIKSGNEKEANDSALLLIAGTRYCSFGIINLLTKELTEFGYYSGENKYSTFFKEQETLKKDYSKAAIAIDTAEMVIVPIEHYQMEDAPLHLQAIYGQALKSNLISEEVAEHHLQVIYRVPVSLHDVIMEKYSNEKHRHIYSVWMKNFRAGKSDVMMLDFKTDDFSVMIFKQNQLILAQTFYYSVPEDVLYHLLKCCQQLDLSQQTVKVSISGLIEKDSAVYRELYKYFLHLDFDGLYGDIKPAEALQIYPDHYYSSISKLAACVL